MTNTAEQVATDTVVLGRYRVVMPLAQGGQGVLYLALGQGAAGFRLPVVIKRVLAPIARDPEVNERFVREARITAQLRHPDIVSILDFERESDNSYVMVLEYVHGYDLTKWRTYLRENRRRFDPKLAAYITMRVLEALHYAHTLRGANGEPTPIIHRDISPANVLIDDTGQIKLTDFGIAHTKQEQEEASAPTDRIEIKGKLAYLAPELYRGSAPSPQSDVYACGVMLHQLLTGRSEFHAKDLMSTAVRVATHVPTRLDDARKDVSKEAADLIARALAKDASERPQTARAFASELRRSFGLDLGELPERLARAVREDFFDPRFAKIAGVTELAAIDRAFAAIPDVRRSVLPPALQTFRGQDVAHLEPTRKDGASSWLWVGLAALTTAGAIAFFATRADEKERVVFVNAESNVMEVPTAAAAPPAAQPDPEPLAAEGPKKREAEAEPTPSKEKPEGQSGLTRAFARRRRDVERCFSLHSRELEGAPRVYVAFEVAETGQVLDAALEPKAVEQSELGRCVLGVAKSTRFEKQKNALRFRIPLTARAQKGS